MQGEVMDGAACRMPIWQVGRLQTLQQIADIVPCSGWCANRQCSVTLVFVGQKREKEKVDVVCVVVWSVTFGSAMDCGCKHGLRSQAVCQNFVLQWIADAEAVRCSWAVVSGTKLNVGEAESGFFH